MVDLRDKLTVAFICGSDNDPNKKVTLQALANQECLFNLIKIEGFAPMSKAFQEMFDQCKTEYLIQIDSDMVMHPNAIKRMYDKIEGNNSPENIVMDCYLLRDVHLDMNIYGVKIYKMNIFRKYPFNMEHPSCEVEQLERMKKDGYDIRFQDEVLGEHSPHWTNESIFERYYNLGEKFKLFKYIWTEKLPKKLFDKIKENPTDLNIFAFAGALASIYSDKIMNEEKDFSKKRKEYGRLQSFLEQPHQATLYVGETCNFKCDFCLAKGTKILNENFLSKNIEDIKCGDIIIGFNEKKLLTKTKVLATFQREADVYEITTTKGKIITTDKHPFMNHEGKWITIQQILKNNKIQTFRNNIRFLSNFVDFKENDDYKLGYINGILQGDGNVGKTIFKEKRRINTYTEHQWISLRVKDIEIINRYKKYLDHFQINYTERKTNQKYIYKLNKNKHLNNVCVLNGIFVLRKKDFNKLFSLLKIKYNNDFLKGFISGMFDAEGSYTSTITIANFNKNLNNFLIKILKKFNFEAKITKKGIRLIGGLEKEIEFFQFFNPALNRKKEFAYTKCKRLTNAKILNIKKLSTKTVYNLETDCHTFWANGFASHNCFRQHDEMEQAPDMTPEIATKVIAKFPDIKGICLCGFTETFTSKNLIPILKVLKSAGKFVGIITNGSLITRRFNEIHGWYKPDYISVSLNAHNAEEHEKITHTKTWNTVLDGIKMVVDSDIECYVSSVITLQNIKYIPEFLKLVNSLGVKTVHLHNLLPHFTNNGDNTYFWNNVLQIEHQNLIDELKKLPEANIVKGWPILIDKNGGKNACSFPWYSFSVNGNGSLSICNSVLPANKKYGNIDDYVIWNNQALQEFRDKFCNKELPHCKMCFRNFNMNF